MGEYRPSKREADRRFPVDPETGKRHCLGCNGCGMWHCAHPEDCGFGYAFGDYGDSYAKARARAAGKRSDNKE